MDLTFLVEGADSDYSYTLFDVEAGMQSISFNKFDGIDFTNIDFISLTITGGVGAGLVLDDLKTVPTPATSMLMLAGLSGFLLTRLLDGAFFVSTKLSWFSRE